MSINVTGGTIYDRTNINKNVINGIEFASQDVDMMKKTAAAKIMKLPVEDQIQILGAVKQPEEPVSYTFYCLDKGKQRMEVATLDEVKHFEEQGWVVSGTVVRRL
jgi:hypothetical protein